MISSFSFVIDPLMMLIWNSSLVYEQFLFGFHLDAGIIGLRFLQDSNRVYNWLLF